MSARSKLEGLTTSRLQVLFGALQLPVHPLLPRQQWFSNIDIKLHLPK